MAVDSVNGAICEPPLTQASSADGTCSDVARSGKEEAAPTILNVGCSERSADSSLEINYRHTQALARFGCQIYRIGH